jgi:hypothetical protein
MASTFQQHLEPAGGMRPNFEADKDLLGEDCALVSANITF